MTTQWTRRHALNAVASAAAMAALPLHAQDKEPAKDTKDARDSKEIRIGQSAHLSGPLAPTFQGTLTGQDLAIAEFNAKGGVGGRKVRLIKLDDAYDAKRCVENVTTLIEKEKVTALYGLASAGNVGAVLPLLAEKRVPLICTYSGLPTLRAKQHPYFFTTMASYQDEVIQMVRNLVTLKQGDIGLVYQNAPFGQLMLPVVEGVAKDLGATLVAKVPLEPNGSDAAAAAQSLAAGKPSAIIFMGFGPSFVSFVRAARAYVGVPIYAISIANSKPLIAALGNDARGIAITQTVPYPWRVTTPLAKDFNEVMNKAGIPIDYDHMFGYMNMRILLEGLRRAGKSVTSESLVKTFESMGRFDFGGYPLHYSPSRHHGSSFVEITIVGPNGRYMR